MKVCVPQQRRKKNALGKSKCLRIKISKTYFNALKKLSEEENISIALLVESALDIYIKNYVYDVGSGIWKEIKPSKDYRNGWRLTQ